MKLIQLIAVILMLNTSYAQESTVRYGPIISITRTNQVIQSHRHEYKVGFSFGAGAEFKHSKRSTVFTGLTINHNGFTNNLYQYTDHNGKLIPLNSLNVSIGYLSLSVIERMYFKKWYLFGGSVLGCRLYTKSNHEVLEEFMSNVQNDYHLGAVAGIGFNTGNLYTELSYQSDIFSKKLVNNSLSFNVGLYF